MVKIILIIAAVVIIALAIGIIVLREKNKELLSRVVELRDKKPETKTVQAYALQLSNEIAPYIKEEGDEIVLKIFE